MKKNASMEEMGIFEEESTSVIACAVETKDRVYAVGDIVDIIDIENSNNGVISKRMTKRVLGVMPTFDDNDMPTNTASIMCEGGFILTVFDVIKIYNKIVDDSFGGDDDEDLMNKMMEKKRNGSSLN